MIFVFLTPAVLFVADSEAVQLILLFSCSTLQESSSLVFGGILGKNSCQSIARLQGAAGHKSDSPYSGFSFLRIKSEIAALYPEGG